MASSSDRDKDPDSSEPKKDNPFIKFRQFADSHISSLLQGVIGLPSAFSKSPTGNTRWADFDEDLRRRDELRARQESLRESEAKRLGRQEEEEEVEIPVKKWGRADEGTPMNDGQMDEKVARDIPLYSPVSKSLFAHLNVGNDGGEGEGDDWNPPKPTDFFKVIGSAIQSSYGQLRSEHNSDHMTTLQRLVYNDLNSSTILRSQYSLLPYLLFSPYSPIKLSASMQPPSSAERPDYFPYCDAFEDLIQITHGRQMDIPGSRYPFGPFGITGVIDSQSWIYKLRFGEILQLRETREIPPLSIPEHISALKPANADQEQEQKNAQTEQEMYERFLHRATSSPTGIADALESLFADAESRFEKAISEIDSPGGKRTLKEMLELMQSKTVEEKKKVANPEKVVFTSTTSEHTTNEDGSVETSVTVWKRFADGRETVTTTSHTEDPAREENEWSESTPREKEEEKQDEKKTSKKGWFWN